MEEITKSQNQLSSSFSIIDNVVNKSYLSVLEKYDIEEIKSDVMQVDNYSILYKLNKVTITPNEDIYLKLSTVYSAVAACGGSIISVIDSNGNDEGSVDFYIGVKHMGGRGALISAGETFSMSLGGNFPGIDLQKQKSGDIKNILDEIIDNTHYISAVSGVANVRNKTKTVHKNFIQGIEKFIDTMKGKPYTAMFIADVVTKKELSEIKTGYQELYNNISPFAKNSLSFNQSRSEAISNSISNAISNTVTDSVAKTQSHTKSNTESISLAKSKGTNLSLNVGGSSSNGTSNTGTSGIIGAGMMAIGGILTMTPIAPIGGVLNVIGEGLRGVSGSNFNSTGVSAGGGIGKNFGTTETQSKSRTESKSESETRSQSNSQSISRTETVGNSSSETQGITQQIEFQDKRVVDLLEKIQHQLKRIEESEDYGVFDCCAYFMSSKESTSIMAANTYKALLTGENSSVEASAIHSWKKDKCKQASQYLKYFQHPVVMLPFYKNQDEIVSIPYTAATRVSGLELPLHIGFPNKSVNGLPVVKHASFERNIIKENNDCKNSIQLGKVHHMGMNEKTVVKLDLESLSSHTFVTGSTGSGKSNTVFHILNNLLKQEKKFLIIEPAKGEYKTIFGKREDVKIYGTNPMYTELLRINPFKFPGGIHILEHLDRIIEIFMVCWPMYAAMPAVLKEAIERSYINAGWDLMESTNKYGYNIYPNFLDVVDNIFTIMNESQYSADSKSDYIGALSTRLKSLTNGINGMIFVSDDLTDEELFDSNVVVDLSRVGSSETKALIMGLLIMKLQEYRMATTSIMNEPLKHVTVLEEAHNILKRTSIEQSQEGANLLGKSVEMLANSIAEMRAFGEGFIIVDQSPNLLDMAAIRNTNTKIIHRLPDLSDRELVGKAVGLNEEQIHEISKLKTGIAAVCQNDWLSSVLCKVDKLDIMPEKYSKPSKYKMDNKNIEQTILTLIMSREIYGCGDKEDMENILSEVLNSTMKTAVKCRFLEYVRDYGNPNKLRKFVYEFFNVANIIKLSEHNNDIENWIDSMIENIEPSVHNYTSQEMNLLLDLMLQEQLKRDVTYEDLYISFVENCEIRREKM